MISIALLCWLVGCAPSWERVFERVVPSVVPLQSTAPDGHLYTHCSAVIIRREAPARLLTVDHCLADPLWADGILVVPVATSRNVILLEARGRQAGWRARSIRRDPVRPGLPFAALGYAYGIQHPTFTTGVLSVRTTQAPWQPPGTIPLFDFELIGGMSGGAIVDRRGHLFSLVMGLWIDRPGVPAAMSVGVDPVDVQTLAARP